MILSEILVQAANANLLLGFIPESLGLLIFGIILIVSTIVLRSLFKRWEIEGDKTKNGELETLTNLQTERKYADGISAGDEKRGVLRR